VNTLARVLLIAGMVGTSIGIVVHLGRAAAGVQYAGKRSAERAED